MPREIYSGEGPVCPLCGLTHTPDEPFYYDDNLTQMDCGGCGVTFAVEVYTSTSWTTSFLASCDTHPKDGDALAAPLVSGAVPNEDSADAQTTAEDQS